MLAARPRNAARGGPLMQSKGPMVKIEYGLALSIVILLGGCEIAPRPPATATASRNVGQAAKALIGESLVLAEWGRADNRAACFPLAFRSDGGAGGTPSRATASGGWAVGFDQPDLRSAYGIAGVGLLREDRDSFTVKVDRLARQWPAIREWEAGENLPAGTAAGYGPQESEPAIEPTPEGSQASSQQWLAHLRIRGQQCRYEVWSKLGRDHLELLLGEIEVIRP